MCKREFVPVTPDDPAACSEFRRLMVPYSRELDEHGLPPLSPEMLEKWIASILRLQGAGEPARHLELCTRDGQTVGFLYGKVDLPHHRGYIRPGWGYIMEFYVLPELRRQGHGRAMVQRLEEHFLADGVRDLYLTADPVTGKPFWEAMGYVPTGAVSPDNGQEIFVKQLTAP